MVRQWSAEWSITKFLDGPLMVRWLRQKKNRGNECSANGPLFLLNNKKQQMWGWSAIDPMVSLPQVFLVVR